MFKNSMKNFDEVNNILVDVSWRFTTVIIIDCIVFISICSCLIFAIRSYNKNAAAWAKKLEKLENNSVQADIDSSVIHNGLRQKNILKENQIIDADDLQKAIADKNIIINDSNDFSNIPDIDLNEYGKVIVGKNLRGKKYFFRIKLSFYETLSDLIEDI